MPVSPGSSAPEQGGASAVASLERSVGGIVSTLVRISQQSTSPLLWPEPISSAERDIRQGWLQEFARHFHNMRRHARHHCPPSMLLTFEAEMSAIEIAARAAAYGHIPPFRILGDHIHNIEAFQRKWVPYIDPPPKPSPRLRYDEADRSVWLDGRCLAHELNQPQFGFVRSLVEAYPDPVKWAFISNAEKTCLGANQTRVRNSLPRAVKSLLESGPKGYAFRLPDKMSTAV